MGTACPQCELPSANGTGGGSASAPSPSGRMRSTAARRRPPEPWHQTSQGRIVLGTLLSAALCYGLLRLGESVLRGARAHGVGVVLGQAAGYGLFGGLQALAVVAAGLLAGAGQRRPGGPGAALGFFSGLLIVGGINSSAFGGLTGAYLPALQPADGPVQALLFYGLPAVHAACGLVGAWLGHWIWRPPPVITMALLRTGGAATGNAAQHDLGWAVWNGPVAWLRVLAGTFVAVGGGVFTKRVIEFILEASEGYFEVLTEVQHRVTTGEVFALSILLGGCVAGATTRNGLKQGFCVGVGAGVAMVMFFLTGAVHQSGTLVFPILSAAVLGPFGGWFGTELMPPGQRKFRRKSWLDDAPPTALS